MLAKNQLVQGLDLSTFVVFREVKNIPEEIHLATSGDNADRLRLCRDGLKCSKYQSDRCPYTHLVFGPELKEEENISAGSTIPPNENNSPNTKSRRKASGKTSLARSTRASGEQGNGYDSSSDSSDTVSTTSEESWRSDFPSLSPIQPKKRGRRSFKTFVPMNHHQLSQPSLAYHTTTQIPTQSSTRASDYHDNSKSIRSQDYSALSQYDHQFIHAAHTLASSFSSSSIGTTIRDARSTIQDAQLQGPPPGFEFRKSGMSSAHLLMSHHMPAGSLYLRAEDKLR
eukprot:gb/GEZN01013605.1/.p1 GENE.gb/GEZN01013605.1/~~gb/GEZN01013605.1/.p1  ORF type:complete len:284 (+),score=12.18 gb/GEZN01013605.1/:24-875(+)